MKAVILAGGRGTRLAPVTHGAVPKPMAELLGAPMLEHIVALLKRCGFRDLCCTTACLPEQIERYFGDGSGFGVRMQYRREDRALGTAGAVKTARILSRGKTCSSSAATPRAILTCVPSGTSTGARMPPLRWRSIRTKRRCPTVSP